MYCLTVHAHHLKYTHCQREPGRYLPNYELRRYTFLHCLVAASKIDIQLFLICLTVYLNVCDCNKWLMRAAFIKFISRHGFKRVIIKKNLLLISYVVN